MRARAILIFACVLLCSCVSREETAARAAAAQANREQQCVSFGYKKGTPDYSKCLESLYLQDQRLAAASAVERRHSVSRALVGAGRALQSISPPPPSMMHCDTMPNGIGTSTTCY
jgi:hypothetical protein